MHVMPRLCLNGPRAVCPPQRAALVLNACAASRRGLTNLAVAPEQLALRMVQLVGVTLSNKIGNCTLKSGFLAVLVGIDDVSSNGHVVDKQLLLHEDCPP